jgi:DNA-3-methyladenine glycosylase
MNDESTPKPAITSEAFDQPVQVVARLLLGTNIYFHGVGGMIVETEAYDETDPASYSYRGRNEKNKAMFGSPGTVFIYPYRGMWPHLNLVCQPGSGVLIRAILPDARSVDEIRKNRETEFKGSLGPVEKYCSGPGKLGIGLGVDDENFSSIDGPACTLLPAIHRLPIVCGTRINVPKNPTPKWRWAIADCPAVSTAVNPSTQDGFTGDDWSPESAKTASLFA